jgi:nucleoid DNA-binding protein
MSNFKELIDTVALETSIPAGQVRKVASAILEQFKTMIEKDESFRSPFIKFKTVTLEPREPSDGKTGLPERKIARMSITTKEEKT